MTSLERVTRQLETLLSSNDREDRLIAKQSIETLTGKGIQLPLEFIQEANLMEEPEDKKYPLDNVESLQKRFGWEDEDVETFIKVLGETGYEVQ